MADAARKEKLAAAKKKLKKFQQKSSRTPASSPAPVNRNQANNVNGSVNGQSGSAGTASPLVNSIPSTPQNELSDVYSTPQQTPQSDSRLSESTERLHQLTRQINGLLSETELYMKDDVSADNNNSVHDLEQRNRELAALLQKHTQMNEQLSRQMHDMKNNHGRLQGTIEHERKTFEERLKRELGALKEQLQVHIQTIGILVAEKTELQSSLTQTQKLAEQRLEEVEELSGRLKASRQRVGDLEKSFTTVSSSSHKNEQSLKGSNKEIDRLKLELYKINKSNEEIQQQNSELKGKLQKKNSECASAEDQVLQLKGKLEMTELHLQQLQNTGTVVDNTGQIEQLLSEKAEIQGRVIQYEEAFQKLTEERDQISQQYQEYIDQLTTQTHNLQAQINALIEERDQYSQKHKQLEAVIEQLQQTQEQEHSRVESESSEKSELVETVKKLQSELQNLAQQYQGQVNDNQQLSRLIAEREEKVMELDMTVQRLSESQVDQTALLDNIQSDKTAISRAMAQNKELKAQLAELQNGFVTMSNENMELMTSLQTEQHTSKELGARLGQQEDELKDIRETLSRKELQLHTLQETVSHMEQRQGNTSHDDHLINANEQLPLVETLQRELSNAQDTINALTNQNSELKSRIIQGHAEVGDGDNSQVEHMSASIRQLESERNQVLEQLREEQHERHAAQDKLHQLQHELAFQAPATLNGDVINKAQFEALQHAMKQLEGKYTQSMRDKAECIDKIEQLEHLNMQLEGESETIGEYISLYQMQRGVLRQRQSEKEEYISRLARDREEMSDKLGQLQSLVMQLLAERNMLHAYHAGQMTQNPSDKQSLSNHVIQPHLAANHKNPNEFGAKLESSNLEDWPDYSSNSSDESEVEQIIGGAGDLTSPMIQQTTSSPKPQHDSQHHHHHKPPSSPETPHSPNKLNIPAEDQTAHRIMHLLSELGSSNVIERTSFTERNFVNCSHCSGRLQTI